MTEVNFIQHLKTIFLLFAEDDRLNPTHISLYYAYFQIWNHNRFPNRFYVNREEVMRLSKIGSKSTYHRCAKDLNNFKYLIYFPSHNPYKGSEINMLKFGTSSGQVVDLAVPFSGQAVDLGVPNSGQALVSIYKHNKQTKTLINGAKRQIPQSENEILEFFKKEKWSEIEAQKFFNYYESTGWKIGGKVDVENWRALAKKWMLKAAEFAEQKKTTANISTVSQNRDNLHTTRNKDYNQPL